MYICTNNKDMIKDFPTTTKELPITYLQVRNGELKLTDKELQFVAQIVTTYMKHYVNNLREPYLSKHVFGTEGRKEICDAIGDLSAQNFNNKLKQLVDKGVLLQEEGGYKLVEGMLPEKEVIYRFNIVK